MKTLHIRWIRVVPSALIGVLLMVFCTSLWAKEDLQEVELVPETILKARGRGAFKEIQWSVGSSWFDKLAPVCRAVERKGDFSKLRKVAEEQGMTLVDDNGPDSSFHYQLRVSERFTKMASGNPKTGKFSIVMAPYTYCDEDEYGHPIVKPLPGRDECVAIAREWMEKLGIDESELDRSDQGPDGFNLTFRVDRVSGNHPVTKEPVEYHTGATLTFAQQIGGLPVLWHGFGGGVFCKIADGGEFCSLKGTLTGWEKMGDYPVLNREEITQALKEGFFWVLAPFECERLEITAVHLEAYHVRDFETQKHFPLIYTFSCKLHGGVDDGYTVGIRMPALKQHRDKYPIPAKPKVDEISEKEGI